MDAPAVDGIAAAISVLNADLERQVGRVAELRELVARLEDYHANDAALPQPSPPVAANGRRRDDGSADDVRRAKQRESMRRRRARLKAEASAKVSTPSVKKNSNGSGAGNNEPAAIPEPAAMSAVDITAQLETVQTIEAALRSPKPPTRWSLPPRPSGPCKRSAMRWRSVTAHSAVPASCFSGWASVLLRPATSASKTLCSVGASLPGSMRSASSLGSRRCVGVGREACRIEKTPRRRRSR